MMLFIRIVAGLHLAVYLGIMWYGWQSYKLLRKKSWRFIGIGFTIFLIYRLRQFIRQIVVDYPLDAETTLIPFLASVFLLIGFWLLSKEHRELMRLASLANLNPLRSGAQPVEYWLSNFRQIVREETRVVVREEIAAASGTTTVTVKGPSSIVTEPIAETPPE